jgi:VWFA-related protein
MSGVLAALALFISAPSANLAIQQVWQPDPSRPDVNAYVTVTDADHRPISNLTADEFMILENGVQIQDFKLDSVRSDKEGINIGLVMDNSLTIKKKLDYAKEAATGFIQQIGPNDRVLVFRIGNTAEMASDFTTDQEALISAVNSLEGKDTLTLLYDGIYDFLKVARALPAGQTVLILLTDGRDDGSSLIEDDILRVANEAQIPLYTIGFAKADNRVLGRLARLTGGQYQYAPESWDLPGIYEMIASQLKTRYRLQYRSLLRSSGYAQLTVRLLSPFAASGSKGFALTAGSWARPQVPITYLAVALLVLILAVAVTLALSRRSAPSYLPEPGYSPAGPATGPDLAPAVEAPGNPTVVFDRHVPAKAELVVRAGPQIGASLSLRPDNEERFEVRIGRASNNDFAIPDGGVSRYHAKLIYKFGTFELHDLASTEGTMLNGIPLTSSAALKDGDFIRLGATVHLVFKETSSQKTHAPEQEPKEEREPEPPHV